MIIDRGRIVIPKNNEIRFEPTTACNYRCQFCKASKLGRPRDFLMPSFFREILDRILAETQQYDTLTFTGMGEPLLNRNLEEMTRDLGAENRRAIVVGDRRGITEVVPPVFDEVRAFVAFVKAVDTHDAHARLACGNLPAQAIVRSRRDASKHEQVRGRPVRRFLVIETEDNLRSAYVVIVGLLCHFLTH